MSQLTTTPNAIILTNPSLWHNWISIIRSNAKQSEIWDLIDPSLDQEPLLKQPDLPKRADIDPSADEKVRSDRYTDLVLRFNVELQEHREKREALVRTLSSIQKSVSRKYLTYIINKDTPWQALRALQQAINYHSFDQAMEVARQYRKLCDGPPRGQNLRKWLDQWEKFYAKAEATNHSDVATGLILDHFIISLKQTDPLWADTALCHLQLGRCQHDPTPSFMDILHVCRQTSKSYLLSVDSEFAATLQGRTAKPESSNSRNPSPSPHKECVCGKHHWYSDCFYLMESKRPRGWKPNAEILKKVEAALEDPTFRANIEKKKQQNLRYQASAKSVRAS